MELIDFFKRNVGPEKSTKTVSEARNTFVRGYWVRGKRPFVKTGKIREKI